jgi:hypothetical protein
MPVDVRLGHSRRCWHVRSMSGGGVISPNAGCPVLSVEGNRLDVDASAHAGSL